MKPLQTAAGRGHLPFEPDYALMDGPLPPPLDPARLYRYLLAANGVFLQYANQSMEVLMPLTDPCVVHGLYPATPYVRLLSRKPRIDRALVLQMLSFARDARSPQGDVPIEILFYLWWVDRRQEWFLHIPRQIGTPDTVEPADKVSTGARLAVVEAHSQVEAPARFSERDDADELRSRLYCVFGNIFARPELRVRVGVCGYLWEIPANWVLELAEGICDCVEGEGGPSYALYINDRFDLPRVFWLDGGCHDWRGQVAIGSSTSVDGPKGAGLAGAFDEHFCYKAPSPGLLLPDLLEEGTEDAGPGHACADLVLATRQSPVINFRMAAEIDTFLQLFLLGRLTRFLTYLSSDRGSSAAYENTPEQFSARLLTQEAGFFVSPSNLFSRTGGTTQTLVIR